MTASIISDFPIIKANSRSLKLRKPIYGVGINDAPYVVAPTANGKQIRCIYYATWENMLERAYSHAFHARYPIYIGVSVCNKWLSFMTFKEWMEGQDWKGKHLDKDLRIPGNRTYSPDTCIFVTHQINKLLTDNAAARGQYPQGVNSESRNKYKKYRASVRIGGKKVWLGGYGTPEEAHAAYIVAKSNHIREVAMQQSEPLRSALNRHADLFTNP